MAKYTVLTGEILSGHLYVNAGGQSVVYNSVTYTTGQTFRGVSSTATFTYSGTGSQIVNELSEFQAGAIEFIQSEQDRPINAFPDGSTVFNGSVVEFVQSLTDATTLDTTTIKGGTVEFVTSNAEYVTSIRTRRSKVFYSVAAPTHTGLHNNSYAFFGDSITILANNYVQILSDKNGGTIRNYGVTGSTVYQGGISGQNLINKYQAEVNLGYTGQYVSFAHGTNDVTIDAAWKAQYKSIIQAFINVGFPTNRLIIAIPPAGTTRLVSALPMQNMIRTIADEMGILKYDVANRFALYNGGNASSLFVDDTHPTYTGHQIWARGLDTFFDH